MTKGIFNLFNKFIIAIFGIVLTIILGLNIVTSRGYHASGMYTPKWFNFITLVLAILIIILVILSRKKIINLLTKIQGKYVLMALLIISLLLQVLVIKLFSVNPSWDYKTIIDNAITISKGGQLHEYFSYYPNNILLVCILALVGKIFTLDMSTFLIFNVVLITLSQFLIYRLSTKLAGPTIGFISLIISVFYIPYFFYAPIVYTDTVSLLFLLVPLNILVDKDGSFRRGIVPVIIASMFFAVGMVLKGSLVIFVIALSIVAFLYFKKWKKLYFIIPFVILIIVKTIFNFTIFESGIISKQQVENLSFPVTHWLMMSQNEQRFGKFSAEDVAWTTKMVKSMSKEEVSKYHIIELKKRIKEKGILGNLKYNYEKISHTWTDGTFYTFNKLKRNPLKPENITRLLDAKSGYLVQGYARIQHLFILTGLVLFLLTRKKSPFATFSMLSIIGFFLFFILWEARSRYLVSVTPLLIILSCLGYFSFNKKVEDIQ